MSEPMKLNKFWNYIFLYYLLACLFSIFDLFNVEENLTVLGVSERMIIIISTIGLFGFINNKKIISKFYWQIFSFILLILLGYRFYLLCFVDPSDILSVYISTILVAIILFVPLQYALVRYAYFSTKIWLSST